MENKGTFKVIEEAGNEKLSPGELIKLLKRCPPDDILMVEINDGEDESGVVADVLVGTGTLRGFSYLKVSTEI